MGTLTWLAGWEPHIVENVAILFRRCRDEVAGYDRRNRELLRVLAEREQDGRLSRGQADAAHARCCSCGDRAAHEAEDGSDYTIPETVRVHPTDLDLALRAIDAGYTSNDAGEAVMRLRDVLDARRGEQ